MLIIEPNIERRCDDMDVDSPHTVYNRSGCLQFTKSYSYNHIIQLFEIVQMYLIFHINVHIIFYHAGHPWINGHSSFTTNIKKIDA